MAAGTVHQVYLHSKLDFEKTMAAELRNACIRFLTQEPQHWEHYPRMAKALRDFTIDPVSARALIESSMPADDSEIADPEKFWCLLDYSWLSDGSRSDITLQARSLPLARTLGWGLFEDLAGDDRVFPGIFGFQNSSGILSPARGFCFGDSRTSTPANQRLDNWSQCPIETLLNN